MSAEALSVRVGIRDCAHYLAAQVERTRANAPRRLLDNKELRIPRKVFSVKLARTRALDGGVAYRSEADIAWILFFGD